MNPILRNVIALIVGFVVGSLVNIGLVNLGPMVIALPEGADVSTMESLKASMPLFKPANFLFPFLGHAVGTLAGARNEIEVLFRQRLEAAMAEMDVVPREEFEVVREMARKAREENEQLLQRLEELEQKLAKT